MKVPGQRSSFHICDILDLNTNSETKNGVTANNNTTTTFTTQTTHSTSLTSRDDASLHSSATTIPPYQLPSNINSAMYPELGQHYHSMFPAVTKSWLKENEAYGEFLIFNSNQINVLPIRWQNLAKLTIEDKPQL